MASHLFAELEEEDNSLPTSPSESPPPVIQDLTKSRQPDNHQRQQPTLASNTTSPPDIQPLKFDDDRSTSSIVSFLKAHTCDQLLPKHSKVVIFDHQIPVSVAFNALVDHNVKCAMLWDSSVKAHVGIITVSDFVNILNHFYSQSAPGSLKALLDIQTVKSWFYNRFASKKNNPDPVKNHLTDSQDPLNAFLPPVNEDSVNLLKNSRSEYLDQETEMPNIHDNSQNNQDNPLPPIPSNLPKHSESAPCLTSMINSPSSSKHNNSPSIFLKKSKPSTNSTDELHYDDDHAPEKLVFVKNTDSIYQAVLVLTKYRIHRVPIFSSTGKVLAIFSHAQILRYVVQNLTVEPPILNSTLSKLNLGTYRHISTVLKDFPVMKVIDMLAAKRISAVPVINELGKVIDIYSKSDIAILSKITQGEIRTMTISEALAYRPSNLKIVYTCYKTDTLSDILVKFVTTRVHRLIIVDGDDFIKGIVSLSDVLEFFINSEHGVSADI